jgi:hypothetical protein
MGFRSIFDALLFLILTRPSQRELGYIVARSGFARGSGQLVLQREGGGRSKGVDSVKRVKTTSDCSVNVKRSSCSNFKEANLEL